MQQGQVVGGRHAVGDDAGGLRERQRQAAEGLRECPRGACVGHPAAPLEIPGRGLGGQDLEVAGLGVRPFPAPRGDQHVAGVPVGQ